MRDVADCVQFDVYGSYKKFFAAGFFKQLGKQHYSDSLVFSILQL